MKKTHKIAVMVCLNEQMVVRLDYKVHNNQVHSLLSN